jgi:hypothetical protein
MQINATVKFLSHIQTGMFLRYNVNAIFSPYFAIK